MTHSVSEREPYERARHRAERQAHAELLAAGGDHLRDHTVDADHGQREREDSERVEQQHGEPLLREGALHDVVHRPHVWVSRGASAHVVRSTCSTAPVNRRQLAFSSTKRFLPAAESV